VDKWKTHVIDAYEPLENVEGWLKCPRCGEHPRVWSFDNGRHAKCCCSKLYDPAPVRAESIMSVYKRCDGDTYWYDDDELRKAWNEYIRSGQKQNVLPEGRW